MVQRTLSNEWSNFFVEDELHIVPLGDSMKHTLIMSCQCNPDIIEPAFDGDTLAIVHNAHDKRELYEDGTLKPH